MYFQGLGNDGQNDDNMAARLSQNGDTNASNVRKLAKSEKQRAPEITRIKITETKQTDTL
jgi:hypothetical protein